jgi:outer membrane immunogenic protein
MTRIALTTAVATLALAGAAHAADIRMPVKAPLLAPVPISNWTGFYVGVNAGLGVGEQRSQLNFGAISGSTFTQGPIGAIGGVQAGYNWQFGNWVIGAEADIQASGINDDTNCLITCTALNRAVFDQSLDWFGTVRARIGYTSGPILAYYTGGFAFGSAKSTITETIGGVTGVFGFDDTVTGWTLGSGVEAVLGGNWTGKLEYLYLDLGDGSTAYTFGGGPHAFSSDIQAHIFRAGLNYRIGGTPVAMAYPSTNWSGFYIGANAGSALGRNEAGLASPTGGFTETFTVMPSGFVGGGQVGFNWQTGNIVFGLEADFQGSSQQDDACIVLCQNGGLVFAYAEQTMPWFGTLRGRIGMTAGPALIYLTGGLAYGKIETDIAELTPINVLGQYTFSETKSGWTIGGGVEQPFTLFGLLPPGNNWTIKTEYLYVDLGSSSHAYTQGGFPHTYTTETTSHIFRSGINYHFNAGPVVARY